MKPAPFHYHRPASLADDEILVEARLPLYVGEAKFGFFEFSRRSGDYALAMGLVVFRIENGAIVDCKIGVGGAAGRPRRIEQAEALLNGRPATRQSFAAAAEAAAAAMDPMTEAHVSAAYRRDLVRTVVMRACERAAV